MPGFALQGAIGWWFLVIPDVCRTCREMYTHSKRYTCPWRCISILRMAGDDLFNVIADWCSMLDVCALGVV